jgi:hypothetical protein
MTYGHGCWRGKRSSQSVGRTIDLLAAHDDILFEIKRFRRVVRSASGLRIGLMWESCGEKVETPRLRPGSNALATRGDVDRR